MRHRLLILALAIASCSQANCPDYTEQDLVTVDTVMEFIEQECARTEPANKQQCVARKAVEFWGMEL